MSKIQHYKTSPQDRISISQKSAYAIGMLVNNLQAAALPAMMIILNLGLGLDVVLVGIIGFVPRIFDAVSDPMMGYISDNTRTRWGRRRPYIFAGAIIAGIIFALMWQLPSGYINLLEPKPVVQHNFSEDSVESFTTEDNTKLSYKSNQQTEAKIEFNNLQQAFTVIPDENLNLAEYTQIEINVDMPQIEAFRVCLNESETTGSESYYVDLTLENSHKEQGILYKFKLSELTKLSSAGNQDGNNTLDINAIDNLTFSFSELQEQGSISILSAKLKKSDSFFKFYFWYFMAMSVFFFLAYTVYATPFVAFGYEMTPDYHERTRLHAFANTVGQVAWLGVPWFYAIMANKTLFRDTVHGARTLAIFVGATVAILGIVPAVFCRERFGSLPKVHKTRGVWQNTLDFFKGISTTFKCSPFVKLCAATFLVFNGFQLGISFSLYIMIFYLFSGNDGDAGKLNGAFGTLTSVATLCVIPLTAIISRRIGKQKTFLITISLSMVGYSLKWFGYNPAHPYWLLVAAPFVAFGTGSLFTLMGSMIADVCDYDELKTHKRREGVFGAIYWWMVKVGMALAGLLAGFMLKASGFDQALAEQSDHTLFLLRIFDVGVPLATSAIALVIIYKYSISEERAHEIRMELEARRGKLGQ